MFPEEVIFRLIKHYGTGAFIKALMPSRAHDPVLISQFAKFERLSASPGAFKALLQQNALIDVRPILANVRVPTLVLHSLKDRLVPVENGRYLASQIPGAKYIEYPDGAHGFFECDVPKLCGEIEEFVTGKRESQQHNFERVLATVLFTDIVNSTNRAVQMGDHSWRSLLDEHDRMARRIIERYRGQLVKRLETVSWPRSMVRGGPSIVRWISKRRLRKSVCHCALASMRGKLKSGTRISAASQFTRQHASWPFLTRAKFSFRE